MGKKTITASAWAAQLAEPDGAVLRALRAVYGADAAVLEERLALLRTVVATFLDRFGDRPLRVFRSPGRINLRGMHVDTHGGYLNLMTHQREVVIAVTPEEDDAVTFANIDPQFADVAFHIRDQAAHPAFAGGWPDFIMNPDIRRHMDANRGDWGNYLRGSMLSAQHRFPSTPLRGLSGVLGSDIPRGAALSSSAALCVSLILAALACNGKALHEEALIVAARDAEWYTGSRCGLSDQAAMVLPGQGELVNVALVAEAFDASSAQRLRFPEALRVLVINSYTERSLSGAALIDYTRNRFAYSLAMEIVRQEMQAQGVPEETVRGLDCLSRLSPAALDDLGGAQALFNLLRRIPETLTIAELCDRYNLPDLDQTDEQYFGMVPPEVRPQTIGLRGPLLFGIAESERARLFLPTLEAGDFKRAGALMVAGHNGDRRVCADGTPYVYDVSDAALGRLATADTPIELCPGAYGASSAVLDALVDAALDAGALGASLTGAGIAGTVLALCRAEDADRIIEAVRNRLASPDYAAIANRDAPLTNGEIAQGVLTNSATASACELRL